MTFPSGFLIVDKPSGVTSFSMVSLVRRLTGVRRVGHAGTLDPLASGVLPVAVGAATRLIEYLDDEQKMYVAGIRFGETTDTFDCDGEVTSRRDASSVTAEAIERELPLMMGDIEQTPPAYSAIKVAGKPLYRYARAGVAVTARPRAVHVERIELRSFREAVAEIAVICGKGTYIRSLAHDLGQRLGCGGHVIALRRTRSGGFGVRDAHAQDEIVTAHGEGRLEELMLACDRAVERQPAAIVGAEHRYDVLAGRDVRLDARTDGLACRAYSVEGDLLGILTRRNGGWWHPRKVMSVPELEQKA